MQQRAKDAIGEFVIMMKTFMAMSKEKNAYDLAVHIAKTTGILRELYNDKSVEGISRYENIQQLLNGIKEFTEEDVVEENEEGNIDRSLGAYLQNITLLTDTDKNDERADSVKMMSIHAAKGLEFKYVFVVGLEEGLFPSTMSLYDREGLEEERRLFYVAVTRAEIEVVISYALSRYKFGTLNYCEASRFIDELPQEVLNYIGKDTGNNVDVDFDDHVKSSFGGWNKSALRNPQNTQQRKPSPASMENFVADDYNKMEEGMKVLHQLFGNGTIKKIEGSGDKKMATIQFQEGDKRLMLKFAKLKIES